jgi:hypothetical protein
MCKLLHSLVTSSFLGPNIFLSTLFANIIRLGRRRKDSISLLNRNKHSWIPAVIVFS